ncbi:ROK family transcriptional regulator [Streptomyces neyagawaensis]|uniref:ROK family transcriptional regulator n=1 Tax=Streptomyces neyagawaensis TaxID=42238 RepID=UPI0006E18A8B|nr:ROK family transcriptional regulator [Streptomyces neyagawaensis]MCL6735446.1 ROK family protein [Streptomyces neyagawaensis]MDE1682711.1 ROK family protein [Streptomyces neyagawaensis]
MPASPSTARAINDRLALRLLQEEGPLTAGQLKQLTGLSRPTVADLVERLTEAGLISVVGESGEQRRGPNARLYGIVADRAYLAALDVRTEGVTVVVADLLGTELARASVPIADDAGTGPAVEQAVGLVERAGKEAGADRLHTVAIGAPGLIDPATGELRDSTGLPEWHRRLATALGERLPARVLVENETNLAALAEQRDGAARDRDTFVLLWLGLGTGAAVVLDGTLRRGASGGTGEIGFLPVPGTTTLPSATDCEGGFHSLGAAAAIDSLAGEYALPAPAPTGNEPPAATLVRAAAEAATSRPQADGPDAPRGGNAAAPAGSNAPQTRPAAGGADASSDGTDTPVHPLGDPDTAPDTRRSADAHARFLDALADRLAIGVASVVAVLDPGCVVLGGEVGQAGGEVLAARVEARLAALSPLPTEVRPSALGGAAVLRGALLMARDTAQDELFAPPPR